jgi:hypothetical protein
MKDLECVEGVEDKDDDNIEGWLDEEALLSKEERKDANRDMLLVRTVLVKVQLGSPADNSGTDKNPQLRKLAFKIVNLSTLLLPAWKAVLKEVELAEALLPRDVCTRWNSTYLMLDFAVRHGEVLDCLSGA